jgi:nucleoside-diphosphate-sugar epimerase
LRILVTGANGFIGARLSEVLIDSGKPVRLFIRSRERLPRSIANHNDIIVGDLTDPDSLSLATKSIDIVFHCAANTRTWDKKTDYWASNVHGTRNLLNSIIQNNRKNVRFVHLSTVDVYGYPDGPCNEESILDGAGFGYGESKLEAERIVQSICQDYSIDYTIFRPANIIGPRSPFIEGVGKRLQNGIMLKINGGHLNAGLTDIDTLIAYLRWAAESPMAVGEIYNIRDDYDVSWSDFLDTFRIGIRGRGVILDMPFSVMDALANTNEFLFKHFGWEQEPFLHRLLVRMLGRTCGHSAEKIRQHSGLKSEISFQQSITTSIEWFLSPRADGA